jgi:hypothetical protein
MNQRGINYIIWILKLIGICLLMPFSQTFQKWLIGENFETSPQLEISLNLFILGIMVLLLAYCFAVSSYKPISKKKELKTRGEEDDRI